MERISLKETDIFRKQGSCTYQGNCYYKDGSGCCYTKQCRDKRQKTP